jgi:valyl-tRNA synthetase
LHPYAPFISEELWTQVKREEDPDLIIHKWPQVDLDKKDDEAEKKMELLQEIITGIRTVRSRMNIPPGEKSDLIAKCDSEMAEFMQKHQDIIAALTRTSSVLTGADQTKPEQSATVVIGNNELYIPLGGLIDLDVEMARLQKRADKISGHLLGISNKLSNEQFMSKAPEKVVAREKEKQEDMTAELVKVNANLEILQ